MSDKEKIEKLEWFVFQVSSYFTDSLSVLTLAIQGATQLSQVLVDSDGGYSTAGLDMSWVVNLKSQGLKSHRLAPNTPVTQEEKDKQLILDDFKKSYGLDDETALALYNLQQGILNRAKLEGWSNEKVIYEYNRLVASFVPDNFVGNKPWSRWKGIAGTMEKDDLYNLCQRYGLSFKQIKRLYSELTDQHTDDSLPKDLAHEAVQLAAFTEQSWGFDLPSLVHLASTLGNTGRIPIRGTTMGINLPMERYEISFKGDVDSGRYGDRDFNSDLDAINAYALMLGVDRDAVFATQSQYHTQVSNHTINRVQTFYRTMGNGDIDAGRRNVDTIINTGSPGSLLIQRGRSNSAKQSLYDFYHYLKKGEESNVE